MKGFITLNIGFTQWWNVNYLKLLYKRVNASLGFTAFIPGESHVLQKRFIMIALRQKK